MDINLSVTLDQPPGERDFWFFTGDTFRVVLEVFPGETQDDVDPNDLTGSVLTLLVGERFGIAPYAASIVGVPGEQNIFTFTPDNSPSDPWCWKSRLPYRIVQDLNGGRTTLCYGSMIARNDNSWQWPMANDYGWRA